MLGSFTGEGVFAGRPPGGYLRTPLPQAPSREKGKGRKGPTGKGRRKGRGGKGEKRNGVEIGGAGQWLLSNIRGAAAVPPVSLAMWLTVIIINYRWSHSLRLFLLFKYLIADFYNFTCVLPVSSLITWKWHRRRGERRGEERRGVFPNFKLLSTPCEGNGMEGFGWVLCWIFLRPGCYVVVIHEHLLTKGGRHAGTQISGEESSRRSDIGCFRDEPCAAMHLVFHQEVDKREWFVGVVEFVERGATKMCWVIDD